MKSKLGYDMTSGLDLIAMARDDNAHCDRKPRTDHHRGMSAHCEHA